MLVGLVPALATLAACAPADRPLLAEVCYDPAGSDAGREFVEIFNPSAVARSLAGLRLESGDGATPGRWSLRWTGAAGDSAPPRGRFVIGGAAVVPAPAAIAVLDLQNGPDAVRLVWPDGASEVLGYGALTAPEHFCGAPAPDAPSGQSLARVPDDADLGSNALDFRAGAPSPGRANRPARDAAWLPGSLALDPEQPDPGVGSRLGGALVNRGAAALAAGEVSLHVHCSGAAGTLEWPATPIDVPSAAGDTARFEVALPPLPAGKATLACRLDLAGDEAPENDLDSLRVRIGPCPFEITEIQFHPGAGEGEWIEIRNRSGEGLDPAELLLSDRGVTTGRLSGPGAVCEPESMALLAQSREGLLARYPGLDSLRIWEASPWPSLNNADDPEGIADQVTLREADGTPCARQPYSAAGVPGGVPLERVPGEGWRASIDPGGTPLLPPRLPAPLSRRFEVVPRRLRAGDDRTRLSWSLPWPRSRVAVDIYDLAGTRVMRALPELPVTARGEREWRTGALAPGVYLVVLRARSDIGAESLSETRLLRIEGVAP